MMEVTIHALTLSVLVSLVVKTWDVFMETGRPRKIQLLIGLGWMSLVYAVTFGYCVFITEVYY